MKTLTVLIALTFFFAASSNAQDTDEFNPSEYKKEIQKERDAKDIDMRTGEKSPILSEERTNFKGLNYFSPNEEYRKTAKFKRFDQATHFFMKTTTDRLPEYSLYGEITFTHEGNEYNLNIYQNIELVKKPGFDKHLFLPFNDLTNDKESYGGGRFMDISETGEDTIVIDFNNAYNPYCAYNHKYSCPIPPEANNLPIRIEAGEKKWHD